MIKLKRAVSSIAVVSVLAVAGCGGGQGTASILPMNNPQAAAVTINIGDSPNDRIAALELTISSLSLVDTSGNKLPVLKSPVELEIRNLAGILKPISVSSVPAGTYTAVSLQLSAAEITMLDPVTGQPVETNLSVPTAPISVKFASPLVLASDAATVNLDFNLAASVSIDASGKVTFSPVVIATTGMVPAQANQENEVEEGEVREMVGAVSNINLAGGAFTIMVGKGPQTLTFQVDASTKFEGIGSLAGLAAGAIVEVHALTELNGTLLATKVNAEDDNNQDAEVEGLVVSTTGNPVTQFAVLVRDETGGSLTTSALGHTATVSINSATQFAIDGDEISLSGLNFTPRFDSGTLVKGQNVGADVGEQEFEAEDMGSSNGTGSGGSAITAKNVRLRQQALTGTVSAVNQSSGMTTFTLTMQSDSVFAMLSGQTTVTVSASPSTQMKVSVTDGATVQVRGLLFFTGGKYDLVAGRIVQP